MVLNIRFLFYFRECHIQTLFRHLYFVKREYKRYLKVNKNQITSSAKSNQV